MQRFEASRLVGGARFGECQHVRVQLRDYFDAEDAEQDRKELKHRAQHITDTTTDTIGALPMKRKTKQQLPEYPKVFETFERPYFPHQGREEPSVFNGMVNAERYRITIEKIEEPNEVIAERLMKLWRACDNHHNREPLKAMAERIKIDLPWDAFGIDRVR